MERIWLKSYPEGVPAEIDASAFGSLGDFIKTSVEKFRDRTAFISMGKAMSYGELDLKSRAFASYLQNVARLPRGARVALMMPNLLQYPIAAFGALRAGYVVVNCNPLYSPRELEHQLADSGAEAIVVLENFAATLEKATRGTALKVVIVTGAGDQLGGAKGRWSISSFAMSGAPFPASVCRRRCGSIARSRLGSRRPFTEAPISPDDIAFLQYTGGTTGVPKGAMLTHRNMVANLRQIHAWIAPAIQADRRNLRRRAAALSCVCVAGERLRAADDRRHESSRSPIRAIFPAWSRRCEGTPFTAIPGVNTLFNALLNNKDFAKLDFSRAASADRRRHGGAASGRRAVASRSRASR